MSICAAIHSNALTYLVNAIGVEGCDPAHDTSRLADERIAMSRLFMYGDCKRIVELSRHQMRTASRDGSSARQPPERTTGGVCRTAKRSHTGAIRWNRRRLTSG